MIPESKTECSTREVVEDIKEVVLDDDEEMISYDVSSLYTNVPVDEAISMAAENSSGR